MCMQVNTAHSLGLGVVVNEDDRRAGGVDEDRLVTLDASKDSLKRALISHTSGTTGSMSALPAITCFFVA